ncbi:type I polyketide synthase [Proteus mirabilis]|uniref:type I polyketide synthase n=1 Tax=Proteus mirabilis TaxID=584 RepID=UPI0018C5BB20|nr:SDR family NAD(P)-dependent oxidoreductase [Proteus mirabilis]
MLNFETFYGNSEPIAVIGLSGRFPDAQNIDQFWHNIINKHDSSRLFSEEELKAAGVAEQTYRSPDFVNRGAPLDEAEYFDATLFNYSRSEAELIDPQQRVFLQGAWHALEHAGYAPCNITIKTGVFASARISSYPAQQDLALHNIGHVRGMQKLLGNDKDYLATRIAYKLNLTGPALTIQTACSSSLVAVHMACESLRSGECSMAIAGGIGITFPQTGGYLYQKGMIFSPDGICRPFDAEANGTFAGNGFGIVVLRRLEDALVDGNTIIAVLRGSAINNDGHQKAGFTAPSVAGQVSVIREAIQLADIKNEDIELIEAHATATPLGDPIEFSALCQVFSDRSLTASKCAIGSVKGNIGHLDTAAGITGLIKTILAVNKALIPPSMHFNHPNPQLQIEKSPFYIPKSPKVWSSRIRTAGVSSFGIGGTNCHIIVQSLPDSLVSIKPEPEVDNNFEYSLLLSAATKESLKQLAGDYAPLIKITPANILAHNALQQRQLNLPWRLSIPLTSESDISLLAFSQGSADSLIQYGHTSINKKIAWLFSGMGSQYPAMGKVMYQHSTTFAETIDRCEQACLQHLTFSLKEVMFGLHSDKLVNASYIQAAIVAYEIAMAAHWRAIGILPEIIVGHSCGEYAAAVIAGFYTIEQMMPLAVYSGQLMESHVNGEMIAVFAKYQDIQIIAKRCHVELAAINGHNNLSFAGQPDDMQKFTQILKAKNIRFREMNNVCAAHTSYIDNILDQLMEFTESLSASQGKIALVSGYTGQLISQKELQHPSYWAQQLRNTVMYQDAIQTLVNHGVTHAMELGPTSVLSDLGEREGITEISWIPTARMGVDEIQMKQQAATTLFIAGYDLPWQSLFKTQGSYIPLPLYPFEKQYYWYEKKDSEKYQPQKSAFDLPISQGRETALKALTTLDLPRLNSFNSTLTTLHNYYVDKMICSCLGHELNTPMSVIDIMRAGRILPRYYQLLVRLLEACVEDGYYIYQQINQHNYYKKIKSISSDKLPLLFHQLQLDSEGLQSIPDTVKRAGEQLYDMMTGVIEPVSVIFPEGASQGVEVLYQDFSFGRYFNQIAAAVLKGLLSHYQPTVAKPLRIIEVGGGTGGTTSWLLPILSTIQHVEYEFTDISPIFTRRAAQKFSQYSFVNYREFNLQQSPEIQGFQSDYYDIIIAANVIHATQHIGDTLTALRTLLRSNGHLLMREITKQARLFDFVFGPLVLPLHDEKIRKGKLFLSPELWHQQCRLAGFQHIRWLPDALPETKDMCEHIILASVSTENDHFDQELPSDTKIQQSSHYQWQLTPCVEQDLIKPTLIFNHQQTLPSEITAILSAIGCLSEQGENQLIVANLADPLIIAEQIRQILLSSSDGFVVITQQAWALTAIETVNPAQRSIRSLLKTIQKEYSSRLIAIVDLGINASWSELVPAFIQIEQGNNEIIVRNHCCYLPQLTPLPSSSTIIAQNIMVSPRWHIITGGFGGLGRITASWLVRQGAKRIAILAPRADSSALDWMNNLQESNQLEIKWLTCDCRDNAQCHAALTQLENEGGIEGLIHSAGILDDALMTQLTPKRMSDVFSVKAISAKQFCDALEKTDASYLILYSSAAATIGSEGQAAHSLACGYLDGLAEYARRNIKGLTVISIAWGAWQSVGFVAEKQLHDKLQHKGMSTLTTEEGLAHLDACLLDNTSCRLAMRLATPPLMTQKTPLFHQTNHNDHYDNHEINHTRQLCETPTQTDQTEPVSPNRVDYRVGDNLEQWLTACIKQLLRLGDEHIDTHIELFQLGLDSLSFLDLSAEIKKQFAVNIDAEQSYDDMTIAGLASVIRTAAPEKFTVTEALHNQDNISHTMESERYAPFPLTPIQHAYWIGRKNLFNYGGVACHAIFEWDCQRQIWEPASLEKAWNKVIQRHDMLRMIIDDDGQQRILKEVPYFHFIQHDLTNLTQQEQQESLTQIREALSYRVLPTESWPLFEVEISWLNNDCYRLHINLDLLQFDTMSFKILFDDLFNAYSGQELIPQTFTFRDYCLKNQTNRNSDEWKMAWCYWQDLLSDLPSAPYLPIKNSSITEQPRFTTFQHHVSIAQWDKLKQRWKKHGITPSAGLLTLFALVLGRWTKYPAFTLNLTFFNRQPWHPDVTQLIGDFTSVLPIDIYLDNDCTLNESMAKIQRRLWQHLSKSQVNGVEILREWGRYKGDSSQSLLPIVFTSMLGMTLDGDNIDEALNQLFGQPVYSFAQTPQVWLDHQVMEGKEGLTLNWFCMDDIFADGLLTMMFSDYQSLITQLCQDEDNNQSVDKIIAQLPSYQHLAIDNHLQSRYQQLEQTLENHPQIKRAHAMVMVKDDTKVEPPLQLLFEASSDIPLSVIKQPNWLPNLLSPSASLSDIIEKSWQRFEERARYGICHTLYRNALFTELNTPITLAEIVARLKAKPQYERLLSQWLDLLCLHHLLTKEGDQFYATTQFINLCLSAPVFQQPVNDWEYVLWDYLEQSLTQHELLFSGKVSPLSLLFNSDEITTALYAKHPALNYLNQCAKDIVSAMVGATSSLNILEIGAGTGATTQGIVAVLENTNYSYTFTDISHYFLDKARKKFTAVGEMRYQLFDINAPIQFSHHPDNGYDLIIASNVLHDASHIGHALKRIRSLLKPQGYLLFIEATECQSAMQMATVGFIEGLSAYQDKRILTNKAMLDSESWHDILINTGFETIGQWPQTDSSSLRQTLFLASPTRGGKPYLGKLRDYLSHSLDQNIDSFELFQCENIEATLNGIATSSAQELNEQIQPVAIPDVPTNMINEIIALWSELLGREVNSTSDFFRSGGDSLIATKMISQLHQRGYPATLQQIFTYPCLADFCAHLEQEKQSQREYSSLIPLSAVSAPKPYHYFMVHASDGDPGVYLPLAESLNNTVWGLTVTDASKLTDLDTLLSLHLSSIKTAQQTGPYILIGWSYGAFIASYLAEQLSQQNHSVLLVLIDPVYRHDFIKFCHDDSDSSSDENKQLACTKRLMSFLPESDLPLSDDIACLWLEATNHPTEWTSPEKEWYQRLPPHTQHHYFSGEHWSILQDRATSTHLAEIIDQWVQQKLSNNGYPSEGGN